MDKEYLYGLTKEQLIKLILNQQSEMVKKPVPTHRTGKWKNLKPKPIPRRKIVDEYENYIIEPPEEFRDPPSRSVKQMIKEYEDNIIELKPVKKLRFDYILPTHMKRYPKPTRKPPSIPTLPTKPRKPTRKPPPILPKPTRAPPLPPNDGLNFDDDIFQTENTSLGKFKIISVQSSENKKFKSYTNEFKVKILKKLDDVKEIYHIFQELVKTVKRRRKLSDNDMLRLIIQNEELPNAISTKFNKVENFKLGDLENVINILEYRAIPIEKCKIVVESVKIPTGKGRLYLTKDTISRKGCIITVKNDDTTCLARSIVMAMANLHSERWTKTQLHNGFNKSRKLQKEEAMKLHEETNVEINDYGNDLSDILKSSLNTLE